MTHEQIVHSRIAMLRTRIKLLVTQQWLCVGLTFAALACLLLVAATRLQWWTDAIDYLWAVLLVGAVTGLIIGWTRRITPMVAAQIADERGGLKERLSTAMEISASEDRGPIARAQLADAAQHASALQLSQTLPWRAPRQLRYLAAAGALLLAAIFLPDLPLFQSKQAQLDREAMRKEGQRIQRVAKEIEKKLPKKKTAAEDEEIVRKVAAEMKKLGKDQAQGRIGKKQAMLRMNQLQKNLKEAEQKAGGGQKAEKSMEQVTNQLQQAADKQRDQGNTEQARALSQMAQNVANKDMEAAKKQLEDLAKKMQSGKMSAEEAGKTAELLEQMAQSMQGSNLDKASEQMKDAAQKLEKAASAAKQFQKQMASAKTDAERQKLQQQMSEALQQGAQESSQQCASAGGT